MIYNSQKQLIWTNGDFVCSCFDSHPRRIVISAQTFWFPPAGLWGSGSIQPGVWTCEPQSSLLRPWTCLRVLLFGWIMTHPFDPRSSLLLNWPKLPEVLQMFSEAGEGGQMRCIFVLVYIVFILRINYEFAYLFRLPYRNGTAYYHRATVPKVYLTLHADAE